MIATAVLGIAMAGLVKLHGASIRGMKTTQDLTVAEDIAELVADEYAAQHPRTLPSSVNGAIVNPCNVVGGCKGAGGFTRTFAAPKPGACTTWLGTAGTARRGAGPNEGEMDLQTIITTEADAIANGLRYRIDRVITAHPNPGARATVIDIYACWRDESMIVREIHTRRVVGP
jgi:hypothetical protein